jgi:parallel beta helix pectate lyase-like protein
MIRIIAKLLVAIVFTTLLHIAPLFAAPVTFLATNGSGTSCTFSQPCSALFNALSATDDRGQITCFDSATFPNLGDQFSNNVTIDCSGVLVTGNGAFPALGLQGTNQMVKIRNLTFNGTGGGAVAFIKVFGSGTLILENCVLENFPGIAIDIEPTGAFNLIMKNSRVSNSTGAGVLIKPAAGGSVKATFDGVTITNNAGGLKTDTTNGSVTVDISNSTISNNANNGLVAIGGVGGNNMVTVKNDVIASNGQAGIEASGGTAAVLVNNTVLDSNTGGSLVTVSMGRISTYQNNTIIGSTGTGFTGTAPLQ